MLSNKKYIIIAIIIAIIMISLVVLLPSVYSMPYFSTSSETSYDNSNTWLTSTTVQGALDELYNQKYGCPNGQICLKSPYVYTANIYDINDIDNTAVKIGQSIPNAITQYETPEEAMAALKTASGGTTDYPFFLRHKLSNNIVVESYVGFVITDAMASVNTDMTAGTYYLKGGDNGTAYDENKDTLLSAFGIYCAAYSSNFECRWSGLNTEANMYGFVTTYDDTGLGCNVYDDGTSYC